MQPQQPWWSMFPSKTTFMVHASRKNRSKKPSKPSIRTSKQSQRESYVPSYFNLCLCYLTWSFTKVTRHEVFLILSHRRRLLLLWSIHWHSDIWAFRCIVSSNATSTTMHHSSTSVDLLLCGWLIFPFFLFGFGFLPFLFSISSTKLGGGSTTEPVWSQKHIPFTGLMESL